MAWGDDPVPVPVTDHTGFCSSPSTASGSSVCSTNLSKPLLDIQNVYEMEFKKSYTPMNLHSFVVWLHGYDMNRKNRLLNFIVNGVPIPSTKVADDDNFQLYNHQSALQHADFVRQKIAEELSCNRVAGPFQVKPPGLILNPLSVVPKAGNQLRMVHNLSHPYQNSVNSSIDRKYCKVEYETLDHCVSIIAKLGSGALMCKSDFQNAFRILKLDKDSYKFTGFSYDGSIYFDKNLPFGSSVSCQAFEELSKAVQWILKNKLGVRYVSHILDDFMFFSKKGSPHCYNSLQAFLLLSKSLGLPIKESKTFLPCTKLELHGILVCTETMQLSLPIEKVHKAVTLIQTMLSRQKTTVGDIQVVTGLLNYCTKIVPAGRAFLRRLYDLTKGTKCQSHHVRVTTSVKADLRVWLSFLTDFNCKTIITRDVWCHENVLHVFTDSSGFGYGAVHGSQWFNGAFPVSWKKVNIAIKEFVALYLAWKVWFQHLSNAWIEFHVDNMSVMFNILNQTSHLEQIMVLLREMVLTGMRNSVQFRATHIPGILNVISDHLSRFQVAKARAKAPYLNRDPCPISPHWLPWLTQRPT